MSAFHVMDPLPRTRRGRIALAVTAVLFIASFTLVVRFYDAEGGSQVTGGLGPSDTNGIIVAVDAEAVNATKNIATLRLSFGAEGTEYVGQDGRLTENLRITVGTSDGLEEITFPSGTAISEREVDIGTSGEEAAYPLDEHDGFVILSADSYELNRDGSLTSTGSIPLGLQAGGGVNGWTTLFDLPVGFSDYPAFSVTFKRAFSTQIFAVLILVIAGILAILALVTALLVHSGRRPAEAALLGWSAALLFALPLLRTYLPNGPPFGASIDMYAYLWFILAAGAASVLVVFGWNAQRHEEHMRALQSQESNPSSPTGGPHAS